MFKTKSSKLACAFAVILGVASLSPVKGMDSQEAPQRNSCKKSPTSSSADGKKAEGSLHHSSSATKSSQPTSASFPAFTDEKSIKAKGAELKAKRKKLEETEAQLTSESVSAIVCAQEFSKACRLFWEREKEFYNKFPVFKQCVIASLYNFEVLNDKDEPMPHYQTALVVYNPPWKKFEDRWNDVDFILKISGILLYLHDVKMQEIEKKIKAVGKKREALRIEAEMLRFDSLVLQRRNEKKR